MGRRVYQEIRSAIEDRGGTMDYNPISKRAWNIWLDGKHFRAEYEAGRFPDLDECYTPKVANPKHYSDYELPLVTDGIDRLLNRLK